VSKPIVEEFGWWGGSVAAAEESETEAVPDTVKSRLVIPESLG